MLHLWLRYTQALITQMAQTAVCNRQHTVEQQLCRWLLLSLDRLSTDLGVRRGGVTEAAGELQRAGLIRYRRGHIEVLDRPGLERRSASATRWSNGNSTACSRIFHQAIRSTFSAKLPRSRFRRRSRQGTVVSEQRKIAGKRLRHGRGYLGSGPTCCRHYFVFAAFFAVFFAAVFTVVFAAGLRGVVFDAFFRVLRPSGGGLATCFTARFAALSTAAAAPLTDLLTDLTTSSAVFLTCLSIGPCAASFSAFDLWRISAV